jgi:SET domain-containing protein
MSQARKKPRRGKRTQPRVARRQKVVAAVPARPGMMRVRRSRVHGRGVFALRRIRKGTRVIEYLGDRVSHRQADLRYQHKPIDDAHTFLFIVDRGVVIDGGANGNDARFINHSCDPNCESLIEDRRVFIEAIRTIQRGEELTYDYQIGRDRADPPNVDDIFACRCGAGGCRGSMLWPARRKARAGNGA